MKNGFVFNGKQVESFYAEGQNQKEQIQVHEYQGQDDFVISSPDKGMKEVIYFVKTSKNKTVDEVIAEACKGEGKGEGFKKKDNFGMPVV